MGLNCSQIYFEHAAKDAVLGVFGFREGEAVADIVGEQFGGAELPGNAYLIWQNWCEGLLDDDDYRAFSAYFDFYICDVSDYSMDSRVLFFSKGRPVWGVFHVGEDGANHLQTRGEVPPKLLEEVENLRDAALGKRARIRRFSPFVMDHFFEIPVDLFKSISGVRYDEDIPFTFRSLTRTEPLPTKASRN